MKDLNKIEVIASICHEANRVFCEYLGDTSQPTWENAPDWQQKSAITGVNFHLNNDNTKPSDSHDSWLKEKLNDGWVYGELKNPVYKTHPCIVPFDELPKEQQFKDVLFSTIVKTLKD